MNNSLQQLAIKYQTFIDKYGWSSYTLMNIHCLQEPLKMLRNYRINSMIDLGCGYGVPSCIVAEYLGIKEIWGIDIDDERLGVETLCKITRIKHDLNEILNIDKKFDFVVSFGVLEHITNWDAFINNVLKLSKEDTWLFLSMPNLGSWINRLAVILGYQPRDLEISSKKLYHVLAPYKQHPTIGHVKLASLGAMKEFLSDYGFKVVKAFSMYSKAGIVNIIDRLLKPFPSLARRYIILARRNRSVD